MEKTINFEQFMENLNKWILSCSWIERFNIMKIIKLSHIFYRFQTIPIKILIGQANSKNLYGRAKTQEHPDTAEELRCVSRDEGMGIFFYQKSRLSKR